jgi:hypothetical protein
MRGRETTARLRIAISIYDGAWLIFSVIASIVVAFVSSIGESGLTTRILLIALNDCMNNALCMNCTLVTCYSYVNTDVVFDV